MYGREAHPSTERPMPANVRAGIEVPQAADLKERAAAASECIKALGLTFPVLLDDMQGTATTAYRGWPSRSCLIGTDGRIVWISSGGPRGTAPDELGAALERMFGPGRKPDRDTKEKRP